jgi:[NiFe] hydrogenase assembly HybE family chaperone
MITMHRSASVPLQGDPTSSPAQPVPRGVLDERVKRMVDYYHQVQTERMQGIPILNPALCVEAMGFQLASDDWEIAEGVLITPWFMSLVRLPLRPEDHGGRVGRSTVHAFGNERFDFIGAHDSAIGFHQTCALFSPMGDFRSQALARETAGEVLALLRPAPAEATAAAAPPLPPRRAFLLGRGARTQGAGA